MGNNLKVSGSVVALREKKSSVKQKLVAAIAMLLVSAMMVMTATYAWFTLSTAPEVTGISTSVGANGNLEIALLNDTTYADLDKIASGVGDSSSVKALTEANITWGNLVDLSDASYGASHFLLNPARLNIGSIVDALAGTGAILQTPAYGSDGRVAALEDKTVFGTYKETAFKANSSYGVRAIGTSSALTENQLAMRGAIAAVATNTNSAKAGVEASLRDNGTVLANLAMNYALETEEAPYSATVDEMAAVNAILGAITASKAAIEYALNNAEYAWQLSTNADAKLEDISLDSATNGQVQSAWAALKAIIVPDEATDDATTRAAVHALIDTEKATVAGVKLSEAKENVGQIASSAMSTGSLVLVIPDGAGPLSDIADFTGEYQASITMNVKYNGIEVDGVRATMQAQGQSATYLVEVAKVIANLKAAEKTPAAGEETEAANITDLYGYAVDFAFRTNASSSNLMLQTDGAQRIYSDSNETTTMGGGSYMEFTSSDAANFNGAKMQALMGNIRVVFVSATGVVGVAVPDASGIGATDATYKAPLKLMNYTVEDGLISIGAAKEDQSIMALNQNVATRLTAVVYLDGDAVQNADVANAVRSMSGKLNLQFSSDATLTPMDYTPLHSVNTNTNP